MSWFGNTENLLKYNSISEDKEINFLLEMLRREKPNSDVEDLQIILEEKITKIKNGSGVVETFEEAINSYNFNGLCSINKRLKEIIKK